MIRTLLAVVVSTALGACVQPDGALQVVWSEGTGEVSSVDQGFDFGDVAPTTTSARTLTLRNAGKGPVTVSGVSALGPDGTLFSVLLAPVTLKAGATRQVEARFTPSTTGDFSTAVRFDVDTGVSPVLKLKGHGLKSNCQATNALPFGAVTAGGTVTATLSFTNSGTTAGDLVVAAPDDSQFQTSPGSWPLAPGETRVQSFTFAPTATTGPRHATVSVTSPGCPVTRVLLTGDVVGAVLTWTPTSLDFDALTTPSSRTVTFSNSSLTPVQLSQLSLTPVSNEWSYAPLVHALLVPAASPGPTGQLVPGTVSLVVSYSGLPSLMAEARLLGTTDLAAQKQFELPLVAGAPGFLAAAPAVDFGEVPYFPPSTAATRQLTLRNAGARPLTLGAGPWSVTSANGNTNSTELCAGQFDPTTSTCTQGELTLAPNESRVFELHATVTSLGDKAWQLAIPSSDPRGLLLVPVTARASTFPPCNYRVSTRAMDLGVVTTNVPREASVTITNLSSPGSSECLFSNVHLGVQATPVFTLVGGEVQQRRLRGGEAMTLTVRAETATVAMTPTAVNATLRFEVSAPSNVVSLPVRATLGFSCLVLAPDALDFGAVVLGRASLEREVRAYNRCASSNGVSLLSVTTTDPEFVVTATSQVLPADGTPALVRVGYRPALNDLGPDDASLAFNLTSAGQSWTERVQLRGTGSTSSLNTQTWTTGGPADVLFVLDNSCSMTGQQPAVAANLDVFLQQAQGSGADFHLAATHTDQRMPHTLYHSPSGVSVLSGATPNPTAEWHGLVGSVCSTTTGCPGAFESCIDGAVGALFPSSASNANPGFLRRDASLSVVCLTDAEDQSFFPVALSLALLRSVKSSPVQLRYDVIGPVSNTCVYGAGVDAVANQFVSATGGLSGDICSPTWGTTLTTIGERAFAATDGLFYLSSVPDLTAPIEVSVDGAACGSTAPCGMGSQCSVRTATCVLDQVGPQGEPVWSFDAPLNAVRFSSLRLPTRGQQVRASWVELTVP